MIHLSKRAISAAAGVLLLTVASSAASAHVMGGGMHGFGGHGLGGPGHFGHHGHGFRGTFIGFDDGYYGYGYGSGCGYLRHKAHVTGRAYWWRQYEACLDGY